MLFYEIGKDIDGHGVVSALWNDDIGKPFGGFDKLQVARPDSFFVAGENLLHIASSFNDVAPDNPGKS